MCCVFNLYYQPSAAAARQLGSSTKHSERARIPMPWRSIHQEQEKRSRKRKEEERKRSRLTRLNWNLCGSSSNDASASVGENLLSVGFAGFRLLRFPRLNLVHRFSFRFVSLSVGWSWCWCCGCCVTVDRLTDWLSCSAQWKKVPAKRQEHTKS